MALSTQLQELIYMLKAEAGQSTLVSVGVADLPAQQTLLRRTQETLYYKYDWPHLRVMPRKVLNAGQRYYDMPVDLDFYSIEDVNVLFNALPEPLTRGISFGEYALYDSEEDERADPVLRWDMRWTGSATQIEVWPIPVTNGAKLMFRGLRPLQDLIADDDVCDLDDQLIVLYAASEILARSDSKDAQIKLAAARDHLQALKARSQGGSKPFVLGGGVDRRKTQIPTIRVTSG